MYMQRNVAVLLWCVVLCVHVRVVVSITLLECNLPTTNNKQHSKQHQVESQSTLSINFIETMRKLFNPVYTQ